MALVNVYCRKIPKYIPKDYNSVEAFHCQSGDIGQAIFIHSTVQVNAILMVPLYCHYQIQS